jgi:hypothetical protein
MNWNEMQIFFSQELVQRDMLLKQFTEGNAQKSVDTTQMC